MIFFEKPGILATFALLFSMQIAADPNFELWNKHSEPLYYNVAYTIDDINRSPFQELRPGKWTPAVFRENTRPTIIAFKLGRPPVKGETVDTYTINANKKMIIRIGLPAEKEKFKETLKSWFGKTSHEGDNYIFGPQTGPLLGLRAYEGFFPVDWGNAANERGLSLKGNFTKNDSTKGTMVYAPR